MLVKNKQYTNTYRTNKCIREKINSGINSSCVYSNLQQFFLYTDMQSQQFALLLCLNNKALSKIITYTSHISLNTSNLFFIYLPWFDFIRPLFFPFLSLQHFLAESNVFLISFSLTTYLQTDLHSNNFGSEITMIQDWVLGAVLLFLRGYFKAETTDLEQSTRNSCFIVSVSSSYKSE